MKQPILSVADMRASDAATIAAGTDAETLMYRAGEGVFRAVPWRAPVAIVCGSGNNAGDGYVLALCLADAGIPCRLFLLSDRLTDASGYYFAKCRERGIAMTVCTEDSLANHPFDGCGSVVDCIFGTGFRGAPQGIFAAAIDAVNQSGAYVVAVDINSGLCGEDGSFVRCVRSDLTVSIGFCKPGHFQGDAPAVIGRLVNCDIGIAPLGTPVGEYDPDTGSAVFFADKD